MDVLSYIDQEVTARISPVDTSVATLVENCSDWKQLAIAATIANFSSLTIHGINQQINSNSEYSNSAGNIDTVLNMVGNIQTDCMQKMVTSPILQNISDTTVLEQDLIQIEKEQVKSSMADIQENTNQMLIELAAMYGININQMLEKPCKLETKIEYPWKIEPKQINTTVLHEIQKAKNYQMQVMNDARRNYHRSRSMHKHDRYIYKPSIPSDDNWTMTEYMENIKTFWRNARRSMSKYERFKYKHDPYQCKLHKAREVMNMDQENMVFDVGKDESGDGKTSNRKWTLAREGDNSDEETNTTSYINPKTTTEGNALGDEIWNVEREMLNPNVKSANQSEVPMYTIPKVESVMFIRRMSEEMMAAKSIFGKSEQCGKMEAKMVKEQLGNCFGKYQRNGGIKNSK